MTEPVVHGMADLPYPQLALARAGRSFVASELVTEPLTDGRTAAAVTRLRARAADGTEASFVVSLTR